MLSNFRPKFILPSKLKFPKSLSKQAGNRQLFSFKYKYDISRLRGPGIPWPRVPVLVLQALYLYCFASQLFRGPGHTWVPVRHVNLATLTATEVMRYYFIISGLWIRIQMDPHSFCLLDPDPGGKLFQIKTEKMQGNWLNQQVYSIF